ncbi:hypothetical protein [Blastococcus xanthinilyticus]|uniref:Uncharacterized protein n=1 Tax=Blastococcus xanthinilyticus TaxID=1564164 RepID=A0A5S5CVN8_9ACTN|nr:hypothetical protein [Blastococcus xanthinilyticus]TYP86612.1 hypothetical protein BD833_109217 [Blastococcus xanthinilyticus]
MRMSRVLLAGVAVAGVAATTSAFTSNNTITVDNNVAGYVATNVSGAAVTNIAYAANAADQSRLDKVTFTTSNDITAASAVLTMRLAGATASGQANTCSVVGATTIECTFTSALLFSAFDGLALTVTSN